MRNKDDSTSTGCLLVILMYAVGIASTLLRGLYVMLAWSWLIVPAFHLPALGYWLAVGILFLLSLTVNRTSNSVDDTNDARFEEVLNVGGRMLGDTICFAIIALISLAL